MTEIEDLINIDEQESELRNLSKVIEFLTTDLIKIEKLSKLIILQKKSPSTFIKLKQSLSPEDLSSTQNLTKFSPAISKLTTDSQIAEMQSFTEFTNSDIPSLTNTVNTVYSQGVQTSENLQKIYDQKTIELEKLRLLNPLDLIAYGDQYELGHHFNSYSNKLIKMVTQFFINSLKETTQPNFKTKKGKINFKDTIRASMKYQGDPYELKRRSQALRTRRTKPTIYILIDVSGSQGHGIYISVALAYAFLKALPDYEIVLYTSSVTAINYSKTYSTPPYKLTSNPIKEIQEAERKDLTERIVAGSNSLRFNKKSLLKYSNNPATLFSLINQNAVGTDNDYHFITKALGTTMSEDSLIITFGDEAQITRLNHNENPPSYGDRDISTFPEFVYNNYLGSNRNKIKKTLLNHCFAFHTSRTWQPYHLRRLNSLTDFTTPPTKSDFNFEDYTFYPATPDLTNLSLPETYGDWARQIINILSGKINTRK